MTINCLLLINLELIDGERVSCNFDQDWCGYKPNMFMQRYTGRSPSPTSGPKYDKTTGNFYLNLDI